MSGKCVFNFRVSGDRLFFPIFWILVDIVSGTVAMKDASRGRQAAH